MSEEGDQPRLEHVVDGLVIPCDTGPPFLDCARAKRRQRMQNASTATLALAGVLSLTFTAQAQTPQPEPVPAPPPAAPDAPAADVPAPPSDTSSSAPVTAEEDVSPTPDAEPAPEPAPVAPEPTRDARALAAQGEAGPNAAVAAGASLSATPTVLTTTPVPQTAAAPIPDAIFAEDWWTHARPIIELHGAFRTRAELFHNFSLGRYDTPRSAMWAQPTDASYTPASGEVLGPRLCTGSEQDRVNSDSTSRQTLYACDNKTQAGANLRLRFNPEIHVSDNVRVHAQVDLFDNLALGSTPSGYRFASGNAGQEVVARSGYYPVGFLDDSAVSPSASSNSFRDSIRVKRAWGEYTTPVGELRFGRMPHHWGMGMLYNSGDRHDDDYQSTIDRIMFTTGLKPLDLIVAASWDFPNEGAQGIINIPGAQPYDLAELDDVNQYSFMIMRKKSAELQQQALSRGDIVLNTGAYFIYRDQTLANDQPIAGSAGGATPDADREELSKNFSRRDAVSYTPDVWVQLLYKKFRFELEAAAVFGKIRSLEIGPDNQNDFRTNQSFLLQQFGLVAQLEQKFVEDRLRLGLSFGWGSGDPDVYNSDRTGDLLPSPNDVQINDRTISTFRFHPTYRVDMILNRNILQRVQGSYFIRPSAEYDFMRDPEGLRAGGAVQAIWTRASEFVQTPGHDADLGIELNAAVYFQARDGVLNDSPDRMGGFYSSLQFGVLFPLAGMGYLPGEKVDLPAGADVSTALALRLFMGVMF